MNRSLNSRYSSRVGSYDTFRSWSSPPSPAPPVPPPQAPRSTALANTKLRSLIVNRSERERISLRGLYFGLVAAGDEQHGGRRRFLEQPLEVVDEIAALFRSRQPDHEQGLLVRGHEPLLRRVGRVAAERLRADV